MSGTFSALEIVLLDQAFSIKCPDAEQERLHASAAYLDQKMREIQGGNPLINLERIAVLAALNMAYELLFQTPRLPDLSIVD
jgi:cell division protein ZapA